jgi:flagellar basal-body rod modification protein FlgD
MSLMSIDPNASMTVAQSLATRHAAAAAASTAASSTSAASATTAADGGISSSDFLTLLVTEMKNQDPTQPTDPNAYIQQLVGVNSLQQLISINQDLSSTATATTPTGSVTSASAIGS